MSFTSYVIGVAFPGAGKAGTPKLFPSLQTLYLALGFATWKAADGGRDAKAPIFLLPILMKKKGRELTALEVQLAGEPKVNPVLLHVLSDEFNIRLTEVELIETVMPKESEDSLAKEVREVSVLGCYTVAVGSLPGRLQKVPGFATEMASTISS